MTACYRSVLSNARNALSPAVLEPEEGFEPSTFRLRVEEPSSTRCCPGLFWLLTLAGSSSQCVPDLPSYGRRNDQENDRSAWRESPIGRDGWPEGPTVAALIERAASAVALA
jgi:hypothetical protein